MTTPIIHPIKTGAHPKFPCWLWSQKNHQWHDCRSAWPRAMTHQLIDLGFTHWSPDSPLPPEVTPEQPDHTSGGPLRPLPGTTFAPPPASGPSPAAMEAAKEILEPLDVWKGEERDQMQGWIAAIIDRKFTREGGARVATEWRKILRRDDSNAIYNTTPELRDALTCFCAALQDSREGKK